MTEHVLGSGVAHKLRSVIVGDDLGTCIISGPLPQVGIHLLALCCFIHVSVEHYHIGFLINAV